MVNIMPRPLSPRERSPLFIKYEALWAPEPVWIFWITVKFLGLPGNRRPDHPACNLVTIPTFRFLFFFPPGVKRSGRDVDPSHLVPRLKIIGVILPLPTYAFMVWTETAVRIFALFHIRSSSIFPASPTGCIFKATDNDIKQANINNSTSKRPSLIPLPGQICILKKFVFVRLDA